MSNLKTLRLRIKSVKSTQKITKAMKMVAASKLRRAQERAEAARPYAEKMERMLASLAVNVNPDNAPSLLVGHRNQANEIKDNVHLLILATSDRGLCGAFNGSIVRGAKEKIKQLREQGKTVKILTIGKKGREQLKYGFEQDIIEKIDTSKRKKPEYYDSEMVANKIIALFETGEIDSCSVIYNKFVSALTQKVTMQQLIPLDVTSLKMEANDNGGGKSVYEYEPSEEQVLKELLPRNIAVQIFKGLLENAASEQGARMTAMDNATRNAGEMIRDLTLEYNRSRQATITKELIEIVSGAEAI